MVIDSIALGGELFLLSRNSSSFLYSALGGIAIEVKEKGKEILIDHFCNGKFNAELENFLNANGIFPKDFKPIVEEGYFPTSVVFSVTSDCNLRCVYCYARAGLDSYVITPKLAEDALDVIIRNAQQQGKNSIGIGFLGGGETMLEYSLVKHIVSYVKSNWNGKASFSMVTNGTLLTPERAEYLTHHGFKFTVSLDGPQDVQDTQRPMVNGSGSFRACIKGIKNLKRLGCNAIAIRSTLTKNNIYLLKEMIDISRSLDVPLKVEPMTPTGRGESSQDTITAEVFIEEYTKAKKYADKIGVILKTTYDHDFTPRINFCSANGRSFCVLPSGQITSCSRVTRSDDFLAEQYIIGELVGSSLRVDSDKVAFLKQLSPLNFSQCVDCFAKWYCAGGCHATRLSNSGFMPEDHCTISKHFLFESFIEKIQKGG